MCQMQRDNSSCGHQSWRYILQVSAYCFLVFTVLLLENAMPQIENLLVVLELNEFWGVWGNQLQTAQSTEHQALFTLNKNMNATPMFLLPFFLHKLN